MEFSNFLLQLKNQRSRSKTVCGFFIILKGLNDVLKSKSPCILLNKNLNFNKNETESKMENPTHSFRETNLVLQLIQESQIKKLNCDELELAKEILSEGNFFNICVLSECIVY